MSSLVMDRMEASAGKLEDAKSVVAYAGALFDGFT